MTDAACEGLRSRKDTQATQQVWGQTLRPSGGVQHTRHKGAKPVLTQAPPRSQIHRDKKKTRGGQGLGSCLVGTVSVWEDGRVPEMIKKKSYGQENTTNKPK